MGLSCQLTTVSMEQRVEQLNCWVLRGNAQRTVGLYLVVPASKGRLFPGISYRDIGPDVSITAVASKAWLDRGCTCTL
jgi:hypothetical protein